MVRSRRGRRQHQRLAPTRPAHVARGSNANRLRDHEPDVAGEARWGDETIKTITVDYEHNCETWWYAAREKAKGNPPPSCVGLLDQVNTITVEDEDAAAFFNWAEAI